MPRNFERKETEKLLTPDVSIKGQFTYDPGGKFFFSNSAYSLVLNSTEIDYFELMAILNSKLIDFFLTLTAPTLRGGYHRNNTQYLAPISVPDNLSPKLSNLSEKIYNTQAKFLHEKNHFLNWVESIWDVNIETLTLKTHLNKYWEYDFNELLRIAKKNETQINMDVQSREARETLEKEWKNSIDTLTPLEEKINEDERQLDAIIFNTYKISQEEITTILRNLEVDSGQEKDILQKFAEVSEKQ